MNALESLLFLKLCLWSSVQKHYTQEFSQPRNPSIDASGPLSTVIRSYVTGQTSTGVCCVLQHPHKTNYKQSTPHSSNHNVELIGLHDRSVGADPCLHTRPLNVRGCQGWRRESGVLSTKDVHLSASLAKVENMAPYQIHGNIISK